MIDPPVSAIRAASTPEAVLPPLDLAHLARYTFGDRKLEREILALFTEQTGKSIADLAHAKTDRDWHIAAHTLKGSSRAVGANMLAELAVEAERLGGISDAEACVRLIAALRKAEDATNAFIRHVFTTT